MSCDVMRNKMPLCAMPIADAEDAEVLALKFEVCVLIGFLVSAWLDARLGSRLAELLH